MKKMLSLIMALVMLALPALAIGENSVGLIGGADGPTQILLTNGKYQTRLQAALDAGRRIEETITLTELTGVQTGDAMIDAAIADLISALGVNASAQGDEASMTITLSGKEAATLAGAMSGEDFYLSSNMLGGTVVVGKAEAELLINRMLDMLVTMNVMSEKEAAYYREQIAVFADAFAAALAEEAQEKLAIEQLDFTALEAILPMMMDKITMADQVVVPRMCDPAVSGLQMVLTNEDVHAVVKQIVQFALDNPYLVERLAESMGYPTEAQMTEQWEKNGLLYTTFGFYENKEDFMASQETVESVLRQAMNELASVKILGGDVTVNVNLDEWDQPVYITVHLPLLTADMLAENPETMITTNIDFTYTRQTVPQGVAHICNMSVDDASLTVDMLVGDGSTTVALTAAEPEFEPVKLLDLSIQETASETNPGATCINVAATLYGSEGPSMEIACDGEYEIGDVREYCAGKVVLTAYEYTADPDSETFKLRAVPKNVTVVFDSDTSISGIDYSNETTFAVEAGHVRLGIRMTEVTADPEPSIMTGNVVRPAELNDVDFSNWFVGRIDAFQIWMAEVIQSLPESVLTLLIYAGMI